MLAELIGTRYFGMVNVRLADKIEHGMGSAFNYSGGFWDHACVGMNNREMPNRTEIFRISLTSIRI